MPQRKYTVKRDHHDHRDLIYSSSVTSLPNHVDLRSKMSPVVDQGELGSCTANAIVSGLREYLLLNSNVRNQTHLSRLFLYGMNVI